MIEENELIKLVNEKNPQPGIPYKQDLWKKIENGNTYYMLFEWISGEQDKWVHCRRLRYYLQKVNLSPQLYYDIVVLGLTSTSQRPKCSVCNKETPFYDFYEGYNSFCGRDCANVALRGRTYSKETLEKMSKSHIGNTSSSTPYAKMRIAESNRKRRYTVEKRNQMSITMINALKDPNKMVKSKIGKGIKKGYVYSKKMNKDIRYLSSWERDFIQYCDKDRGVKLIESPEEIEYKWDDGTTHRYFPDFKLTLDNDQVAIIEIKPARVLKTSREVLLKKIAGKKYCYKHGYKYVVLTEKQLYNKKKLKVFSIWDYLV